jgi:hypothetical protein
MHLSYLRLSAARAAPSASVLWHQFHTFLMNQHEAMLGRMEAGIEFTLYIDEGI